MKRRNATLIELLVAMSLLSILLSVLLGFYWQVQKLGHEAGRVRADNFELRYTQYRLAQVIPKSLGEKEDGFQFFTSEDLAKTSLVFTYDNGVSLPPWIAHNVLARLYIDDRERLCLVKWPLSGRDEENRFQMKKEVLLSEVEGLNFGCFSPSSPHMSVSEGHEEFKGKWISEWKKEYKYLPTLIKIEVVMKTGEKILYMFTFPNTSPHIEY